MLQATTSRVTTLWACSATSLQRRKPALLQASAPQAAAPWACNAWSAKSLQRLQRRELAMFAMPGACNKLVTLQHRVAVGHRRRAHGRYATPWPPMSCPIFVRPRTFVGLLSSILLSYALLSTSCCPAILRPTFCRFFVIRSFPSTHRILQTVRCVKTL